MLKEELTEKIDIISVQSITKWLLFWIWFNYTGKKHIHGKWGNLNTDWHFTVIKEVIFSLFWNVDF